MEAEPVSYTHLDVYKRQATNVISLELYRMGFTYYKFGEASALSFLVFLINIVFVVLYVRLIKYDI